MPWLRSYRSQLSDSKKHLKEYRDGDISSDSRNPSFRSPSSSSIQVPVNNVLTTVLVDTGAAISLIDEATLSTMSHASIAPCSLKEVHTANSGFLSLLGLVQLTVCINHVPTYVTAYVTHDLVCPMILGRDWIQEHHTTLNFSTNRLSLYNGLSSTPLLPIACTEPVVMSLSHSIVIPPFHEQLISGSVPVRSLDNALFTPNAALQHSRMVLLPHALLRIRNHRGVISIINNTRHSKVIPRHTPLGFVSALPVECSVNLLNPSISLPSTRATVSSLLLVCSHCDSHFPSDATLFAHLHDCCNKDPTCPSELIASLVQHITDSDHRRAVHLTLHRYHQLLDESCSEGIACEPQSAISTGSHPPLAEHPRRVSHSKRQTINAEVNKLLDSGVITPSNSPWASPVVLVKKSDGSPRFCIDYRRLNSITQKDVYPLPRIDDVIERLKGSRLFSKLDLRSGYFQVPLAPAERAKTAFTTPDGLWEFTRLPQGLKNSPSVFQRLMNQTLGVMRWDVCLAYLDDIVVHSPSPLQHLIDLDRVCRVLHVANFKLNRGKCSFFQEEISFLGHKINANGCSPNDENLRSILNFPVPQCSKAAHSFLQMAGFYRKFIPHFAQISAPLNKFTHKGSPFLWTSVEQTSFDQLKAAMTSPAVLLLPDPSQPYVVRTDASRVGIGAVLLQKDTDSSSASSPTELYRPIAFASRSLKPAEKKYSAIELEALAIWWSVTQKFRPYIEGQPFFLETDHKPLLSIMTKPCQNARVERWMTTLQQYDMIIRHISGKNNTTADALSRFPVDKPSAFDDETPLLVSSSTQTDDLSINVVTTRSMTRSRPPLASSPIVSTESSSDPSDPLSRPANLSLSSPTDTASSPAQLPALPFTSVSSSSTPLAKPGFCLPKPRNHMHLFDYDILNEHQNRDPDIAPLKRSSPLDSRYTLDEHNVLCRNITRKNSSLVQLPYVPASLVSHVLSTYHDSALNGGHFGIKRTFYKIRDRFFWPHLYRDVQRHVLVCRGCRSHKPSRRKPDGHLLSLEPPRGVWERLAMDYVGPVPQSDSGNKYFLVLTDLFSKFVITKAVSDNTSATAAKFLLYDVFLHYGTPLEIITDNGQHFVSALYESLLALTRCCHVRTTPYNPQSNGQCERHNATIVPNLLALSNRSHSNWDKQLQPVTFNYNTTRHDTTGFTPFELMFARRPRLLADLPVSVPSPPRPFSNDHYQVLQQFIQHAKMATSANILHHQTSTKHRYDRHRSNPDYSIGQTVLIRNHQPLRNKFSPKFIGPYTVTHRLRSHTYRVQNNVNGQQTQVHVRDLRSFG